MESSERNGIYIEAIDDGALLIVRKDLVMVFNLKDRAVWFPLSPSLLSPILNYTKVTYDVSKFAQVSGKSTEVVLTTEDAAFITSNDKAQAPTLEKNQVRFSRAAAVVLRLKA